MKTLLITNKIVQSQTFICSRLHKSWLSESKNDARKKNLDFLKENDDFKIIRSQEEYNSFDFKKFKADHIFILPELLWGNDGVNEAYSIARELITHAYKSEFIQLVFLSVLERSTLAKAVDTKNRSFVEAFPHICLLNEEPEIKFEYYSNIHYQLIKQLAISDHGRLQKVGHEMNSVNANIRDEKLGVELNKSQLIKQLEELTLYQAWIPIETNIHDLIADVKNATDKLILEKVGTEISSIISDISLKLPKDTSEKVLVRKNKMGYKIFVIEDEAIYREYFQKVLSIYYDNVFPNQYNKYQGDKGEEDFDIRNAKEIIAKQGKKYQIFLLDLLYKDSDGNWLDFNGLDLFREIRKKNPYAVIRIITSLPRVIVAKVVETIFIDAEKPNTDQVYTKKYGYEALKDSIIESIEKINEECAQKAKLRSAWAPFPKEGFFDGENINNLLNEMMFSQKHDFDERKGNALELFKKYQNNELAKNTFGWGNGSLPSPKMKAKCTPDFFKKSLPNILVHRLIAINEALKDDNLRINYASYKSILDEICNIISPDKGYFQTKLGFNGTQNIREADKATHYFQIELINLFPHENQLIADKLTSRKKSQLDRKLTEVDDGKLNSLFKRILTGEDSTLYEIWNDLNLNFNPYKNQKDELENGSAIDKDNLPDDLTLGNACDFFESLLLNYDNEYIPEIASMITSEFLLNHPNFEKEFNEPVLSNMINRLLYKEEEDSSSD